MTNHPKFTESHDSAARSVGYEGASETRLEDMVSYEFVMAMLACSWRRLFCLVRGYHEATDIRKVYAVRSYTEARLGFHRSCGCGEEMFVEVADYSDPAAIIFRWATLPNLNRISGTVLQEGREA
jgi:hypothetical protein